MNRFPIENIDKVEEATNADLASKATQLETSRTIKLTGDVTGSATFNGTGDADITAVIADNSHNHTIANIDNLQDTLDSINDTIESAVSTAGASLSVSETSLSLNDAEGTVLSTVTLPKSIDPASDAPLAPGIATAGTSDKYAREDHVHPAQSDLIKEIVTGDGILTIIKNDNTEVDITVSTNSAAKLATARKITLPKAYMPTTIKSDACVLFDGGGDVSFGCEGCTGCTSCTSCTSCSGCSSCSDCGGKCSTSCSSCGTQGAN